MTRRSPTGPIDIANDEFWGKRGQYFGAYARGEFAHFPKVPAQTALPFGVSYETFRNPGQIFGLTSRVDPTEQVTPHTRATHWWGGAESQYDDILDVDSAVQRRRRRSTSGPGTSSRKAGTTASVEALVDGEWVTVPLSDDAGTEVTTDTNPHDNNEEGNGLTGTSGGAYFVDDPDYIHLRRAPAGRHHGRAVPLLDRRGVPRHRLLRRRRDRRRRTGDPVVASRATGSRPTGVQDNDWSVQLLSPCDLTPGRLRRRVVDDGQVPLPVRATRSRSLRILDDLPAGPAGRGHVVIFNMTTGDIQVLGMLEPLLGSPAVRVGQD